MHTLGSAPSIRRRLSGWLIVSILTSGLLVGWMAYSASRYEIEEVYDAQLVHFARVLQQLTEQTPPAMGVVHAYDDRIWHQYEHNITYRTWRGDVLVTASGQASLLAGLMAELGFSDQMIAHKKWRVFVLVDDNNRYETAELYDIRYEMVEKLMVSLLLPILVFIALAVLAIWFGVRRSLQPLAQLAGLLYHRDDQDLSPLVLPNTPAELCPMVDALNRLLKRVDTSLQQEREFAEHAAHELRTPLAALKTQIQVLVRQKAMKPAAHEGVANLQQTIQRAEHLVEQLLELARLHDHHQGLVPVHVARVVEDLWPDFMAAAKAKKITLKADLFPARPWQAHPEAVRILLRNIIDNAVKYTPNGGQVWVEILPEGALQVTDTGPGLTAAQKKKVFGRFVRFDRSGQTGAGIGLAIVQRVVSLFHARIQLEDNSPQGLKVRVRWG